MKRFNKLFIFLLCCVSAMSLTSCLGSDDDNRLDPETEKMYRTQMSGYYDGGTGWRYQNKIYFFNDTIKDEDGNLPDPGNVVINDSVNNIRGRINAADSTFVIYNVPGKVLAKEISDDHAGLKKAIEDAPVQDIRGKFALLSVSGQSVYLFFYPESVKYPELTYDGETHNDVTIAFWGPSRGIYFLSNTYNVIQFGLCPAAVYEGETKIDDISTNTNNLEMAKASLTVQLVGL